jgi:hypothetical protein
MMRRFLFALLIVFCFSLEAFANTPPNDDARTRFYNFDEMLIDGEIKKPTGLYTSIRERVRFGRLFKLHKSFMGKLMDTARDRVFK